MASRKQAKVLSPTAGASSARDASTPETEAEVQAEEQEGGIPSILPVLPVRGTLVYPGTAMPLSVGRPSSKQMLDEWLPKSKIICVAAQRDQQQDNPTSGDLYPIGTAAIVLKLIRQPDETVSIIVHGLRRVALTQYTQTTPYFLSRVEAVEEIPAGNAKGFKAEVNELREQARQLLELTPSAPEQAVTVLMNIEQPSHLADFLAANLTLDIDQKQAILEERDIKARVRLVHRHLANQLEIARLQQKIHEDVRSSIGEGQRKHFLREQLKAIHRELGEDEDGAEQTIVNLRKKLQEARPPEKVLAEALRELERLNMIPPASPEYSIITGYLELVAELPWNKTSEDKLDLKKAREILDRDHFDLEKVKRRLIEYLAVQKLNPTGRGPILCLVGPPGVGKTSLGQSIADAMGRQFVRLSLGGIRDEAEVRGHRRTYIGSMPGRIIQEIRRAGTRNPVMMLDEIDKLGADFRGDPASALLEVLDPRQNQAFVDRYLDVPFDLSRVIFICTANYMGGVPPALRDRMEVIDIAGYTDHDKAQIARRYLVPRQLKENGLKPARCRWTADAIRRVIDDYTREAGVRELERQIGAVCRSVAAVVASNGAAGRKPQVVDPQRVRQALGPERYFRELDTRTRTPGVVVGLAYTPVGGEILFIESSAYRGKGRIHLTGQIGSVMKESASAAMSLFKSRAEAFNYDLNRLAELDVHIHVPAGAVPKDGPSAGVAMYTAIVSLLLEAPVKPSVAMTGEITLRGLVLPIGGVKEKSLAAQRAGVHTVILPERNRKDLEEIDPQVRRKLRFEFVEDVDQVLKLALGPSRVKQKSRKAEKQEIQTRTPAV